MTNIYIEMKAFTFFVVYEFGRDWTMLTYNSIKAI